MKYLVPIICAAAIAAGFATEAQARVFVGGGVVLGAPYYAYPPYYGYPYYAYPPAPAYPYPAYPAQPVYANPPAYPVPQAGPDDHYYQSESGQYCREYMRKVVIEGRTQKAYGHACREPDGRWRIMD